MTTSNTQISEVTGDRSKSMNSKIQTYSKSQIPIDQTGILLYV